jgi:integrase
VSSVAKRPDGRWRARYRDVGGTEHARHFARKVDAQTWLDAVTAAVVTGTYVDPARQRVTVGDWSATWLAQQGQLKPSTRARYEGIVSRHVLPTWENVKLADVAHTDIAAWVAALTGSGLAGATVRYVHRVMSLILELAVRDGRLPRNPANGVRLPRAAKPTKRYLSHEQVAELADAAGECRLVILVLAYCGLRWGELAALRVGRVDLLRRRFDVSESVTEVRGHLTWGTPKSGQGRSVPVPRILVDPLVEHLAGRGPDELVFRSARGGVLRNLNFRRDVFDDAATAAGLPGLTPHELRHTAASLAVSSGANVKAVQRMLGHASAAMTLDVYADLFDDDLDAVADSLDTAARRAAADSLRTADVVAIAQTGRASL